MYIVCMSICEYELSYIMNLLICILSPGKMKTREAFTTHHVSKANMITIKLYNNKFNLDMYIHTKSPVPELISHPLPKCHPLGSKHQIAPPPLPPPSPPPSLPPLKVD